PLSRLAGGEARRRDALRGAEPRPRQAGPPLRHGLPDEPAQSEDRRALPVAAAAVRRSRKGRRAPPEHSPRLDPDRRERQRQHAHRRIRRRHRRLPCPPAAVAQGAALPDGTGARRARRAACDRPSLRGPMKEFYDHRETRDPAAREAELLAHLPTLVARAMQAPGWAQHLAGIQPLDITSREALARLPVLRKSDLPALQSAAPPFGGYVGDAPGSFSRLFASPGPIFEPEGAQADPWRSARPLHAAGFRSGDVVLNTFSYHLTPGGFIFDSGARALGCAVIPAGPGNTEQQLQVIAAYRPTGYTGTPDFLKILLEAADATGLATSSLRRAVVAGAAVPPSLKKAFAERGIGGYQLYAGAECGVIAYETPAREGLVVNEDLIVESVRPGTGDPVAEGEVGEVVVTSLDPHHPLLRLALGDLSASMPGTSPCGRTGLRIRGWL